MCDLKTHLSCSDSSATYGSPNKGQFVFVVLELLLFVAGSFSPGRGNLEGPLQVVSHWEGEPQGPTPGSFSLGGGTLRVHSR